MVPTVMGVIVTSKVTQAGSTLSGNTPRMVLVKTYPGYNPATGSPGTGTIIGVV
jgi:hypothetical protein